MAQLENDSNLVCRLCSSKTNLISLRKGKNKRKRKCLKYLVEDIIGIEVEESDYYDCICFSCITQIYNIYVFKTKSIKNEEELFKLLPDSFNKQVPKKKESEIKIPSYQEIKNCITGWLVSKQFFSEGESSESEENSEVDGESSILHTSTSSLVINDHFCEANQSKSFSIQISCKPVISHNRSQTDIFVKKDACTQYEPLKDEYTQYELLAQSTDSGKTKSSKNVHTQCNIKSTSSDKLLDSFFPTNFEIDKNETQCQEYFLDNKYKEFDFMINNNDTKYPLEIKTEQYFPNDSNLHTSLVIKSPTSIYTNSPIHEVEQSMNASIPSSSGLLTVTEKTDYLKTCDQCGSNFYTKAELTEHQKSHKACSLCKRKFRTKKKPKEQAKDVCLGRAKKRGSSLQTKDNQLVKKKLRPTSSFKRREKI